MCPKIEYPKPLPTLSNENLLLESGFTPTETVTLQHGWRLIKRSLNCHARKVAITFFSENYLLLEKFRDKETTNFNLSSLHQHAHRTMNIYGRLIESGFKDTAFVYMLLSDIENRHKLHGVTYDHIKLLTNHIKRYFIEYLDKIKSPTFSSGLEKLTELIIEQHKELRENDDNNY